MKYNYQNQNKENTNKSGRKIIDLLEYNDKIYIYTGNKNVCKEFKKNATKEGFHFDDGMKPIRKRKYCDVFSIDKNKIICYVGFVGHINFHSNNCKIPRINYERYLNKKENYFYRKNKL